MSTRGRQLPVPPAAVLGVADRVPVTALVTVIGAAVVAPGLVVSAAPAVAAIGLLVGLPHGAVDHLVPAWARARRTPPVVLVALLAAYVAAAAVMFGLLHLAPRAGLGVFLVLSLVHFGSGEAGWAAQRHAEGTEPDGVTSTGSAARLLRVLAWGGVVVVLPLVRWPAEVRPLLDGLAPGTSALITPTVRAVLAAVVAAAVLATVLRAAALNRRRQESSVPAAELLLVTAAVLIAPPLVAFAVWFGFWHSLRHIVRLMAADPSNAADFAAGRSAPAVWRFGRQAALPTLAALAVLLALLATSGGVAGFLTLDVQLLAALTVPHMAVVAWLDRHEAAPGGSVSGGAGTVGAEPGGEVPLPGLRVRS